MKNSSILSKSTDTHCTKLQSFDFFYSKKAPMPIQQTKISVPDRMIKQIPLHPNPQQILHLYLSHNKIQTLKGIQPFSNLQSFNISYNLLYCKQEFAQYMSKISGNMKKLSIRKNNFEYGIEDYVVDFFPNLQKLDDIALGNQNKKKCIRVLKMKISDKMIEALLRTERLLTFLQDIDKKQMLNSQLNLIRRTSGNSLKLIHQNISESAIAQLALLPDIEKGNQSLILQNCGRIISLFLQSDLKCTCRPYNYRQQSKRKFVQILGKIMIRYSARNNKIFLEGLQRVIKESKIDISRKVNQQIDCDLGVRLQYVMAFGKMGGFSFKIDQNPGKFIKKISFNQLKKSPMNQFVQRQTKQRTNQKSTLNGPGQSKWERLLKLKQNCEKQNKSYISNFLEDFQQRKIEEQWIFEKIPMFAYQQNYVQIIHQILYERRTQILVLYNKISYHKVKSQSKISLQKQNKSGASNKLKKDRLQMHKSELGQNDQIITFKGNNQDSLDLIQPYQQDQVQRQGRSYGLSNKQTNMEEKQSTRIPSHQSSYIQTKRMIQCAKGDRDGDIIEQIGYKKYSLHQINIIYKALRSLKKNMLEMRKRRLSQN